MARNFLGSLLVVLVAVFSVISAADVRAGTGPASVDSRPTSCGEGSVASVGGGVKKPWTPPYRIA